MAEQEDQMKKPGHVALIMDGNRRWAQEQGLEKLEGHQKGKEKVHTVPEDFFRKGVPVVTVYAFSTENWRRKKEEVEYLMELLEEAVDEEFHKAIEKGARIVISGRYQELPGDLPRKCEDIMERSKDNTQGTLNICLNYGGRAEIVDAVKKLLEQGVSREDIDENKISENLYRPGLGEPDVIIRTSGEKRLSGFQLWESAYSELMFVDKYWPDFSPEDVDDVIGEFARRKRRYGG